MSIDKNVAELLRKRDELQTLYDDRKGIGDFKAISDEISQLLQKSLN